MRTFTVSVALFCLYACAPIPHVPERAQPGREFLIADASTVPVGFYDVSIYGDVVAWRAHGSKEYAGIYYKDLRNGKQFRISSSMFDGKPSVYENTIVWANTDRIGGNQGIYIYDVSKGLKRRLVDKPPQPNPKYAKIFDQYIVWHGDTVADPDIVSALNLKTGKILEISRGKDVHGVDIFGDIVVWGNYGIWAMNLKDGQVWRISSDTEWPYSPLIHGDLVVWMDQVWYDPANDSNETSWDIYGVKLSEGRIFPIDTDPSYHSSLNATDTNGEIVLWIKNKVGKKWRDSSIWATKISTGEKFLISKNAQYASVYEDLVIYSRNKNIYGYYLKKR